MTTNVKYDLIYGDGENAHNLGELFQKYDGGITDIKINIIGTPNNTYVTGTGRYGENWAYGRFDKKQIKVDYIIYADTYERQQFSDELGFYLGDLTETRRLYLHHIPNRYFNAVPSGSVEMTVDTKHDSAKGTITFDVPDGLSHSTITKKLSGSGETDIGKIEYSADGEVIIDVINSGTAEAYPKFKIKNRSDNGWIGIGHKNGMFEIGHSDADEAGYDDFTGGTMSRVMLQVRKGDNTETGWKQFVDVADKFAENPMSTDTAINPNNIGWEDKPKFGNINQRVPGLFYSGRGFKNTPNYKWEGGMVAAQLKPEPDGTTGATDWRLDFNVKTWESVTGQTGVFNIGVYDANNRLICGYDISKQSTTTGEARVKFSKGSDSWLNYNNAIVYHMNNNEKGQKVGNPAFNNQRGQAYIVKDGSTFIFGYNGKPYSWKIPDLKGRIATQVIICIGRLIKSSKAGQVRILGIESLSFTKTNAKRYDRVPNKFIKGSVVTVDMSNGDILLDVDGSAEKGQPALDQRVRGSKTFSIPPGKSQIVIRNSKWASELPEVEVEWVERWK